MCLGGQFPLAVTVPQCLSGVNKLVSIFISQPLPARKLTFHAYRTSPQSMNCEMLPYLQVLPNSNILFLHFLPHSVFASVPASSTSISSTLGGCSPFEFYLPAPFPENADRQRAKANYIFILFLSPRSNFSVFHYCLIPENSCQHFIKLFSACQEGKSISNSVRTRSNGFTWKLHPFTCICQILFYPALFFYHNYAK